MSSYSNSDILIRRRASNDRGHADHGWLNSYHTFSFANYYDRAFNNFHCLRVINEDRVASGGGFPTHPHSNYEIFSYVVQGALAHKDSMGNVESIDRGDVQFTSAGTGVTHSEYNADTSNKGGKLVHFLQIWVQPNKQGLKPEYQTRKFTDEQKHGKLCLVVEPKQKDAAKSSVTINQDFYMYASMLKPSESVEYDLKPGRALYAHVVQDVTGMTTEEHATGLRVGGHDLLHDGDGAFIELKNESDKHSRKITFTGHNFKKLADQRTEFVLFDIAKTSSAVAAGDDDDDDDL